MGTDGRRSVMRRAFCSVVILLPSVLAAQPRGPAARIPAPYWGRWGVGGVCPSDIAATSLTTTIAEGSITFYAGPRLTASVTVRRVLTSGGRLTVEGEMGTDGDGDVYAYRQTFVLNPAGTRLDRVGGPESPAETYLRCRNEDVARPVTPDDWPGGTANTVVLSSETSLAAARAVQQRARNVGVEVGLLWSSNYSSLRPGYWVVFSGYFVSSADAARRQTEVRTLGFPQAYARRVAP